jgi:hypothetical protein
MPHIRGEIAAWFMKCCPLKLTISSTALYRGLAAPLTIALDVLTIGLGVTGQSPDVLPVLITIWAVLLNRSAPFSLFALEAT